MKSRFFKRMFAEKVNQMEATSGMPEVDYQKYTVLTYL